jgi:multidrug resistance efflux pump/GAF domain-containing protein
METNLDGLSDAFRRAADELAALRQFPGSPREFWPRFLAVAAKVATADIIVLLAGQPGKTPRWVKLGEWAASTAPSRVRTGFTSRLEQTAERCLRENSFIECTDAAAGGFTLALRLTLPRAEDEVVLAAQVVDFTESAARESLARLSLIADTAALYQLHLAARQAASDVQKFSGVLDLLVPVNEATLFFPAALAFCNGIATRFRCDRASLGWLQTGAVHLRAISRTEHFDRRMAAAQALETVMEECLDQDVEILWPQPEGSPLIARDHEKFAAEQRIGNVCSLPLRVDGKPVAVLTCERAESPFTEAEVQQLRLCADQVARALDERRKSDRWFGALWADAAREQFKRVLGPEHTWRKVAAIAGAVVVLALFLVHVNYRVEGNFILRSDEASYLTAPFDGYVEKVLVRTGDPVAKGAPLLELNRSELLLDQSSALADVARYQRESQKAEADHKLAEKRIADALAQQAQARLDLVRYRLTNAVIRAPFEGVVVEGDWRERIASPVRQGDAIFKVASIASLYAEADISEKDVKEILGRSKGEIAFVTQPKSKYPVTVEVVEPAAVTKKDGNVFLVRLKPDGGAPSWWRPGMTGLCKISAEKRSLFWILTHRTVDFLRMKLWV